MEGPLPQTRLAVLASAANFLFLTGREAAVGPIDPEGSDLVTLCEARFRGP